ncbi:MAG: AMP-binding protein, partial [Oscillospiraceae bacterium]|nr:AMP-binding protein [Oscillospiraceae bacterium]
KKHLPNAQYVNLYGPTEITCNCTYHIISEEYEEGDSLPIGRPFRNERVFLLDEDNKLVTEAGRRGEICVCGTALALGYYNNPQQTEAAFVQNPLNTAYPETIYRTGDIGAYGEDGLLYFLSRKDFQIKHMGQRIELGEIETAMGAKPGVTRACCVYDRENPFIVAFYSGEAEVKEIISALKSTIPQYMIPNRFIKLEALPLTENGKTDRKLLEKLYVKGADD